MTVLSATKMFTIRLWKRAVGNPSYRWSNTYEVDYEDNPVPTPAQWRAILLNLMDYERSLHTPNVEYVKGVVSSWDPNGPETPYEPGSFLVRRATAGTYGNRLVVGQPLPRHIALHIARSPETGLEGKLHFRGALVENDIESTNALDLRLNPDVIAELQTLATDLYNDFRDALGVGGAGNPGPANLAMISTLIVDGEPALESRPVLAFPVVGVSAVKPDHKYFDVP